MYLFPFWTLWVFLSFAFSIESVDLSCAFRLLCVECSVLTLQVALVWISVFSWKAKRNDFVQQPQCSLELLWQPKKRCVDRHYKFVNSITTPDILGKWGRSDYTNKTKNTDNHNKTHLLSSFLKYLVVLVCLIDWLSFFVILVRSPRTRRHSAAY